MQILSPKILRMGYNEFKNTNCEYYIRGRLKGLVKRQHNVEHLISKVEPYIFDAALEIGKKKHYYDYSYEMDDFDGYEELKMRYLQAPIFDFMAVLQVLQQPYFKRGGKSGKNENFIN